MTKKHYKMTIFALVLLIGAGSIVTYTKVNKLNSMVEKEKYNFYHILWHVENEVKAMDHDLAQAIVATEVESLTNALKHARERAVFMGETDSVFDRIGPFDRYHPGSTGYGALWSQSVRYLDYLESKEEDLKPIEKKNLNLIRNHLSIILPAYGALEKIRERETEINDERAHGIIKTMIDDIHTLPNIGEDDQDYQDFINESRRHYRRDNIFSGEATLSEAALKERAIAFLGDLWNENMEGLKEFEQMAQFGGAIGFYIKDNSENSRIYEITVTKEGGHILGAEFELLDEKNKDHEEPMTDEEAIDYTKMVVDRWKEEALQIHGIERWPSNREEDEETIKITYVPVREGIPLNNREVGVIVRKGKKVSIDLDANNYFSYYNQEPSLTPKLTPDEVLDKISNDIEIAGEPKLEVRRGESSHDVLVYAIPVKGIEKVERIYINAIDGRDEGIEYDY